MVKMSAYKCIHLQKTLRKDFRQRSCQMELPYEEIQQIAEESLISKRRLLRVMVGVRISLL